MVRVTQHSCPSTEHSSRSALPEQVCSLTMWEHDAFAVVREPQPRDVLLDAEHSIALHAFH